MKSDVEGTAPAQTRERPVETASISAPAAKPAAKDARPPANPFLSPLDEMTNQPAGTDKPAKEAKKPAKVAKNKKP